MEDNAHGRSTNEVVDLLEKVDLFDGLPRDDLLRIAGIVGGRTVEGGQVLFEEGVPGDAFYIVAEGALEIVKRRPDGTEERLAVRRDGDALGEMALLDDAPRSATVRAAETSHLLVIERSDLLTLLGGDTLAVRMLQTLSRALRALGVRFTSLEKLQDLESRMLTDPLEVSRVMQAGLLPRVAPRVEGFDVAAGTTTESTGRGGSAWDWIELGDGRTALLTLDVRQDGFPPAYHLGMVRAVMRGLAGDAGDLQELLARTNDALSSAAIEGLDQFVAVGVLVPSEEGLEWASAGKVPAGVIRRGGAFEELAAHGPPMGMMGGFKYNAQRLGMGAGDTAFVLSHASQGMFMGAADLVAQLHGKPAGEVVATLHKGIRKAQGEARTEMSVLYLRRH